MREVFTKTMELARADKTLGSSLEASVTLHVQNPAVAAWLSGLNTSGNAADELKYLLITSGVTLVDSAEAAAEGALASSSVDTGAEVAGVVTVGVRKAPGVKCARCWMYSTQVRRKRGGKWEWGQRGQRGRGTADSVGGVWGIIQLSFACRCCTPRGGGRRSLPNCQPPPSPRNLAVAHINLHPPFLSSCLPSFHLLQVGEAAAHPDLCERCLPVVDALGFKLPGTTAPAQAAAPAAEKATAAA